MSKQVIDGINEPDSKVKNQNLLKSLDAKLEYLYTMSRKYSDLNDRSRGRYKWRENAINERIEVLEELKSGILTNDWDECYEEDLREYERE